jgi:hypothetical protein
VQKVLTTFGPHITPNGSCPALGAERVEHDLNHAAGRCRALSPMQEYRCSRAWFPSSLIGLSAAARGSRATFAVPGAPRELD